MYISTGGGNSVFLLVYDNVAIVNKKLDDSKLECDIIRECDTECSFLKPCESKLFNIQFIRKECCTYRKILDSNELKHKAVYIPYSDGHVIYQLLNDAEK